MRRRLIVIWPAIILAAMAALAFSQSATDSANGSAPARIAWADCLEQPAAWYRSKEAARIADNLLLYQRASGGWPKNIEMAAELSASEKAGIAGQKSSDDSTIDNNATYTQLAYLARVYSARREARYKESFLRGLDYLLAAQYENGGWPQYYPRLTGYYRRITFNDEAMIGVMRLLRDVAEKKSDYLFVDEARRKRAARAVEKGIECILKCQIVVDGKLTAWCAQHDEVTLEPADARSYEKASLSGSESVGITRFLMSIERPSERVVAAIEGAVAWLREVRIEGLRIVRREDAALPRGYDLVEVEDRDAPPLWARFYEIGTNRPIFCGRDGVIKRRLSEIEHERRTGYNWYVGAPARLLDEEYPRWRSRWLPEPGGIQ